MICRSLFDVRAQLLHSDYGLFSWGALKWIGMRTNSELYILPPSQGARTQSATVVIVGSVQGIFMTRRFLTGLLPISLQFELPAGMASVESNWRAVEAEFGVQIEEKKRGGSATASGSREPVLTIRSYEANLASVYKARCRLLSEPCPLVESSSPSPLIKGLDELRSVVKPMLPLFPAPSSSWMPSMGTPLIWLVRC